MSVVSLALVSDFVHSPTLDEVGHLTAGLFYWEAGSGELYEVNPPLVKLATTAPVAVIGPKVSWQQLSLNSGARTEWHVGRDFISLHGSKSFRYFSIARLVQLAFVGIWLLSVKLWATEIAGPSAGFVATLLSAFCPMVMGWSATICPDVPAAAICVWSFKSFRTYLLHSTLRNALVHGIVMGLAFLTKSSLVILPLIFLLLIPVRSWKLFFTTVSHSCLVGFVAIYVVCAGYGFERCLKPLGEFHFFQLHLLGEITMERCVGVFPPRLGTDLQGRGLRKCQFRFRRATWKDWICRSMTLSWGCGRICGASISLVGGGIGISMRCW